MSNREATFSDRLRAVRLPAGFLGPVLITCVVIAAHISFGVLDSWTKFIAAILAAMATELVLHKITTGEWRNLSSAYISGNSAGILVRSPLTWPFVLCAMISITSKYVLRYKGRHLWNPTNFGIVAIIFIASDYAAVLSIQWGSNMWAMLLIWIVGFFALWQVRLFHVSFAYVCSFFLFAWIRSLMVGDPFMAEISPITGPMYQLFVLFMITDPKTTVSTAHGRILVAFLIGLVEFFFRLNEAVYAPFYALFVVGPIALIVEDWIHSRNVGSDSHRKDEDLSRLQNG
jgi:enediyne biosynthesis protein E5